MSQVPGHIPLKESLLIQSPLGDAVRVPMEGNVSGYVCNHGSPNEERDTASPGLWTMLRTQASDEEADDVFSRRHLYCGTPVVTSWAVAGQQVVFFHMYLQTESR